MSAPNPDLVGNPQTKSQFLASAMFAKQMAEKVLSGDTEARDPQAIADQYIRKSNEYLRKAEAMT